MSDTSKLFRKIIVGESETTVKRNFIICIEQVATIFFILNICLINVLYKAEFIWWWDFEKVTNSYSAFTWRLPLLRVVKIKFAWVSLIHWACLKVPEQQLYVIWWEKAERETTEFGEKALDCCCLCWWRQVCLPKLFHKCAEVFLRRQTKLL